MIHEILITDRMRQKAEQKAKEMGTLRHSITEGEGNVVGFLGEYAAWSIIGGKIANTYQYDLILPDGRTVDVKSKRTKVVPQPFYECSVYAYNIKQECNFYCFVRVSESFDKAWIVGMMDKSEFYRKAAFVKKGTIDGSNRFEIMDDCYNLKIHDLHDAEYIAKCTF